MAKSFLTKTLVQGWWGIVSFFVNFFAVYTELEPDRVAAIEGWAGRVEAEREIESALTRFRAASDGSSTETPVSEQVRSER